uniref:Uncharacterized protein n=1 Tax=Cacopsylla melanoneura TaxID=428564 RepID=A0A8D8LXA9_9HEMI
MTDDWPIISEASFISVSSRFAKSCPNYRKWWKRDALPDRRRQPLTGREDHDDPAQDPGPSLAGHAPGHVREGTGHVPETEVTRGEEIDVVSVTGASDDSIGMIVGVGIKAEEGSNVWRQNGTKPSNSFFVSQRHSAPYIAIIWKFIYKSMVKFDRLKFKIMQFHWLE